MSDQNYKFKTNIKCGGCIATVTPHLNALDGVENWKVDLESPDRVLTVESNGATESQIMNSVTTAGYKIEKMS
jgi:copper chaperone